MSEYNEYFPNTTNTQDWYVAPFCGSQLPLLHVLTCSVQVALSTYVKLVSDAIFDVVPKQVQYFLVLGVADRLEDWMLDHVTPDHLKKWLSEDPQSQRKRKELERKLAQFEEGLKILDDAEI